MEVVRVNSAKRTRRVDLTSLRRNRYWSGVGVWKKRAGMEESAIFGSFWCRIDDKAALTEGAKKSWVSCGQDAGVEGLDVSKRGI